MIEKIKESKTLIKNQPAKWSITHEKSKKLKAFRESSGDWLSPKRRRIAQKFFFVKDSFLKEKRKTLPWVTGDGHHTERGLLTSSC